MDTQQHMRDLQGRLNMAIMNRDAEIIAAVRQEMDMMRHKKEFKIFVYGTLKQGCMNHVKFGMNSQKYIEEIAISGYRLLEMGMFPAMVTGKQTDTVIGELYQISDVFKHHLDEMEVGFTLYKISDDDLYAYILNEIPSSHVELQRDTNGYFNYTPTLERELAFEMDGNFYKQVRRAQDEQISTAQA